MNKTPLLIILFAVFTLVSCIERPARPAQPQGGHVSRGQRVMSVHLIIGTTTALDVQKMLGAPEFSEKDEYDRDKSGRPAEYWTYTYRQYQANSPVIYIKITSSNGMDYSYAWDGKSRGDYLMYLCFKNGILSSAEIN